jgi:heat-inducible transcriptional repressor
MREAANFLNARLGADVSSCAPDGAGDRDAAAGDRHACQFPDRKRPGRLGKRRAADRTPDRAGPVEPSERGTAEAEELDRIRQLFDDLERKRDIAEFLELTETGEGVRIFIGSENKLFSLSGSSLVVSPYMNADRKIVGAVGVIGPTRLNYGRIVPIVDYTAQLVGRMISDRS